MKRGRSIILVSMLLLQGCKLYMRVAAPAPEPAVAVECSCACPGEQAGEEARGAQAGGGATRGQSAALENEKRGRP